MTDQTIEDPATTKTDATAATPTAPRRSSFTEDWQGPFSAIGMMTVAFLLAWAVYAGGKSLFYDDAFNDGFEAGRASIARACANPDQSLAVARGYPK